MGKTVRYYTKRQLNQLYRFLRQFYTTDKDIAMPTVEQTSFDEIINKYRENSTSERNKGDKFERLIKAYLETKPIYKTLLSDVRKLVAQDCNPSEKGIRNNSQSSHRIGRCMNFDQPE